MDRSRLSPLHPFDGPFLPATKENVMTFLLERLLVSREVITDGIVYDSRAITLQV